MDQEEKGVKFFLNGHLLVIYLKVITILEYRMSSWVSNLTSYK